MLQQDVQEKPSNT